MVSQTLFSSDTGEWATPQDFFDQQNEIHHFTLDAAASHENAKCDMYYTKDGLFEKTVLINSNSGLVGTWGYQDSVWLNPPYGRDIGLWVEKAYWEYKEYGNKVVCLLPARSDTRWYHEWCYERRHEGVSIEPLRGRLKFGGAINAAPFPSILVVYNGG